MVVPASPFRASTAFASEVMMALSPPSSTNMVQASTLGPMLPGRKWPSSEYFQASAGVIFSKGLSFGLP